MDVLFRHMQAISHPTPTITQAPQHTSASWTLLAATMVSQAVWRAADRHLCQHYGGEIPVCLSIYLSICMSIFREPTVPEEGGGRTLAWTGPEWFSASGMSVHTTSSLVLICQTAG